MALSINSNPLALGNQQQLDRVDGNRRQLLAQLSSGKAVNTAADNAASLAISEALRSQRNGDNQAIRNAVDGVSLTQTADGALSQLTQNTQRIEELAIQAGNGALSGDNRAAIQKEVDQLTQANSQIVQNTQFNGQKLFDGGSSTTFQLGADGTPDAQVAVNTANLSAAPGSGGLNAYHADLSAGSVIDVVNNPAAALGQARADLGRLQGARTDLGAASNRFETAIDNLGTRALNTEAARSRIQDADFAAASSELVQQQILSNSRAAVQAQSNLSPQYALSLLR